MTTSAGCQWTDTLSYIYIYIYQYGRNEDKVLKCTNIPSDIDSIHNRRPKPSFGDIWSTARGPRPPPPSPEVVENEVFDHICHLIVKVKDPSSRPKIANDTYFFLNPLYPCHGGVDRPSGTPGGSAPNVTKTWLWSPVMY